MNLPEDIDAFVADWVDAWNAHNIERVLGHFADNTTFLSPFASRVISGSDGILRGKDELRAYWVAGLAALPDLHFEVVGVYAGIDTIAINYRNHTGGLVTEVLTFEAGRVIRGEGTYLR